MIRVTPSQIVSVIEQLFPQVHAQTTFQLHSDNAAALMALLALIDELPQELLPATFAQYNALIIALATLRQAPQFWASHPRDAIVSTPGGYSKNPIRLIYDTLKECPDEAPVPGTTDLLFIINPEFRAALRLDISNAYQALANGEWKAATVLAGSVVEALLLWVLQQETVTDLQQAITAAMTNGTILRQLSAKQLDRWDLAQYIAVAEQLQKINTDTATLARLAKDFRNLIHPGRAQRQAQACTRGTAMTALGAVQRVIECLTT